MKKLLSVLVGLVLAVSAAGGAVTAFADDTTADLTPDFSDNFDSYSTEGFIEDDASFRQNWENELMLNIDGNEMAAADSECKGVARVIADPAHQKLRPHRFLLLHCAEGVARTGF